MAKKKLEVIVHSKRNKDTQYQWVAELINRLELSSEKKTLLSIDVGFEDGDFIFFIDRSNLDKLQNFQKSSAFDELYQIQVPYQKELLQAVVWYGFTFTTCYNADETDFKSNIDPVFNKKFKEKIIRTSISLDGDSFNYISKNFINSVKQDCRINIVQAHYWLINQALRSFKKRFDKGFFLMSWLGSGIVVVFPLEVNLKHIFNPEHILINIILRLFGLLILISLQILFQPLLIRCFWRQLMNPQPRSLGSKLAKYLAKLMMNWGH